MVDRKARNQLIDAIGGLAAGRIDNFDFDAVVDCIQTDDMGVVQIRQAMWHVYDDLHRHTLTGKWALSDAQNKIVERFILFLRSNLDYQWPPQPLGNPFARLLVGILTLGFIPRYFDKKWRACGSWEVWPFISVGEFNDAKPGGRGPVKE